MTITLTPKRAALALGAAVLVTVGAISGAAAITGDDDERGRPIPAADLDRAERAALEETGGGRVTDTEVGDEESRYEVEVTLDDGTEVDVQLDAEFQVVGTETDGPSGEHDD